MHSPVSMGPWPHNPKTLSLHWCVLRTGDEAHVPTREHGPGNPKSQDPEPALLPAARRKRCACTLPEGMDQRHPNPKTLSMGNCLLCAGDAAHVSAGGRGPGTLLAQILSPEP